MEFYTGASTIYWTPKYAHNFCVSYREAATYKPAKVAKRSWIRPARSPWILDSGAFSVLARDGHFAVPEKEYAQSIIRYQNDLGNLAWAAPQDWLCGTKVLARTGKTVAEHQLLTTQSVIGLRQLLGSSIVIPVLQGRTPSEYLAHVDLYAANGIDLTKESTVGIGSINTRGRDQDIVGLIIRLATEYGLALHTFGFGPVGISQVGHIIRSSDSMAWAMHARRNRVRLATCVHKKPVCSSCPTYAQNFAAELKQRFPFITN